jgi:hypothetical protein
MTKLEKKESEIMRLERELKCEIKSRKLSDVISIISLTGFLGCLITYLIKLTSQL